ncbi:MAG TPA: Ger(x)C family spore germination protein [Mollicutes bacterium]|nr:Ger(x)C family spore germination protein [Mollicutes bacterium]
MKTKAIKMCIIIILTMFLTGCFDYRGLDEFTIVAGTAIDVGKKKNTYQLSFEIIDLAETTKEGPIETTIIESTGKTIMDAIRNIERKIKNRLYYGHSQVLIISKDVIQRDGLALIIDSFIRDIEVRETLNIVISNEPTAKELLNADGVTDSVVSFEMKRIIKSDNETVGSTKNIALFEVFNALKSKGASIVLPLFKTVKNDEEIIIESDGVSVFNKDKIIGSLTPADAKYYLFISDCIGGGIINLNMKEEKFENTVLEIRRNDTKTSFDYKENKFTFFVNTNTELYLDNIAMRDSPLELKDINKIKKAAEKHIKNKITDLINKTKKEFKSDIFDFGTIIYKKNPKLWSKIRKDWDELFINSDIKVNSKVMITNAALMK